MTLKELAKITGVSTSTISRVLNDKNYKCATEKIKNKILDAVAEYGYVPNDAAKRLKAGVAQAELKVLSCIFSRAKRKSNDEFFESLAKQIKIEILKQTCKLGFFISFDEIEDLKKNPEKIKASSGVVILGKYNNRVNEFIQKNKLNAICISLNEWEKPYDQIICDGKKAAFLALNHLFDLGHRKIAYVGEPLDENRFFAYATFLKDNKLPFDKTLIFEVSMSRNGGMSAAAEFYERNSTATAFFCANDITAIGLIEGLKSRNSKVFNTVSVISIDDLELSNKTSPTLTTVKIPIEEISKLAIKIILDRIEGGHKLPLKVEIPSSLVVRESVKRTTS